MTDGALIDVIPAANELGEGIVWNALDGCAWWTDIQRRRIHRWKPAHATIDAFEVPERAGSFSFVEGSEELIVAFESGIALHDLDNGRTQWLGRPENSQTGRRFNDGRCDRRGRFWVGTMVEDDRALAASASLYCVDGSGTVRRRLDGLHISNGLCFSPDSRYCYVADSARHVIFRCEVDPESGQLGERRVFAETPEHGFPDGATIDSDGCMWSAQWGSNQVIRYTPHGRVDRVLAVPAAQPSCVAFAGPDLDLLLVTSARAGLSVAALADQPMAGRVFIFRPGHTGLIEPRYRKETQPTCASRSSTT